jgi:hypothetical protein
MTLGGTTPRGGGRLPHGFHLGSHRHSDGQLVYAAAGAFTTTTARGTWVAPANRVTWTQFRKQVARAELQRQFTSPAANRLFGELTAGVN